MGAVTTNPAVPGAAIPAGPLAGESEPLPGMSRTTPATRPSDPAPSTPSSSSVHGRFDPGTRLGTRYRVVAMLGRGGMGEVYRADDLELGQSVALKFLPEGVSRNPVELARFRNEVRLARQIAHPNVCRIYDIGEADGHVFLSMEYIDGEDLASVLRRMGRPSPDKAIEIARQLCFGLAAAHESGVLHRDLKPANVMIDGRGRVRITDFGLAGLVEDLAKEGKIAGTPAYMAPEQLAGGPLSVQSDIYALGLVLYEVFTGKRAFSGATGAELRRERESGTITTPTHLVKELDPVVERLVLRCLESNPENRPPSVYAVLGALPGGDPLAAALAAGETPSPELVANAGQRGGLRPAIAFTLVAGVFLSLALRGGIEGRNLRSFTEPAPVLSLRAGDLLEKTGAFPELPPHTAQGFEVNLSHQKHLAAAGGRHASDPTAAFYWRRWSTEGFLPRDLHDELPRVADPAPLASGAATVLLDPQGRLRGLLILPSKPPSTPVPGSPRWGFLFEAAGIDTSGLTAIPPPRPAPVVCDSVAAWRGKLPGEKGDSVTVEAGSVKGRPVYFSMDFDWGSTTQSIEDSSGGAPASSLADRMGLFIYVLIPLPVSIYFARRNLLLGRGDRRGATRLALYLFAANLLESMFTLHFSEVGPTAALWQWFSGRTFGHCFVHAVTMWFIYVALEPYVRRIWPHMLVSWARLVSGRFRDPLVGRDVLVGAAAAVGITLITTLFGAAATRLGQSPAAPGFLNALATTGATAYFMAYSGSVSVLGPMLMLFVLFLSQLLLGRTWAAALVTGIVLGFMQTTELAPSVGWFLALVTSGIYYVTVLLVILRFGLLSTFVASFIVLVMGFTPATLDLSAWYASRALLVHLFVLALTIYGFVTALAGRPIFGDPIREERS
jgi:serine/threonine-protein kinase